MTRINLPTNRVRFAARACMLISVIHTLLALTGSLGIFSEMAQAGLWNTVPAPWIHEHLETQLVFWASLGSFAVPLFLLGALLEWIGRAPPFLGWSLLGFAIVTALFAPISGFWTLPIPAVLLIVDARETTLKPVRT
jgi:Family of unknown function (DUF6463)